MAKAKTVAAPPSLSRVFGFSIGFLTLGVGVLRGVGPSEVLLRGAAAGTLAWMIGRCFAQIWGRMADEILENDE
ncbi:MAG: hypothetical protein GY758_11720 [Fuerstiella sp.]|nr:hypothetical protein [Fuerstiella sp.]MCP4511310.1 hypothetical protein [Fuerstiella sp.]MDG2130925.1 hypothetical protein [Fuerstiella sp.]